MESLTLPYGRGTQSAGIPGGWRPRFCDLPPQTAPAGEQAALDAALAQPLFAPPLERFAGGGDRVLVVVPDKTRRCRADLALPSLLARLRDAGLPPECVRILFANGTHAQMTEGDMRALLGDAVCASYRVGQHDARDDASMVTLGHTLYGTELRLNRAIAECDAVIALGTIVHHYFAGFGGGAKLFLPGIASHAAAVQNHRRALTAEGALHPACNDGSMAGNPVAMDIADCVRFLPPVWYCAPLLDRDGRIEDAVCGDLARAHAEGCSRIDRRFRVPVGAPADLVITSAGGAPKDITFIQAHKALHRARAVLRPGGAVILLAECGDGIGSEGFLRWFAMPDAEFRRAVLAEYTMNAHTAAALREKTSRFTVVCVSALPPAEVERMGMTPASSFADAVAIAQRRFPGDADALVIPQGGLALPCCSEEHPV